VSRFPTISDEALGALRALVGKEIRRPEPYVEVATRDAIRHWAHGIGDRNPLWAAARLAPPTILFAMDRIVSGYVTGLPGIHAMYAGTDFRWRRAVREGDRVLGRSVLLDLEEKASTFARRAIRQTYRTTFVDDAGRSSARRTRGASGPSATPRASSRSTGRSSPTATRPRRSSGSAVRTRGRRSAAPRRATGKT